MFVEHPTHSMTVYKTYDCFHSICCQVGTAVVIAPVELLQMGDQVWNFKPPQVLQKLYDAYEAFV